jgi:hypothetical protein
MFVQERKILFFGRLPDEEYRIKQILHPLKKDFSFYVISRILEGSLNSCNLLG